MRWGICAGIDRAGEAAEAGYEYIEENISYIAGLDDSGYAAFREKARTAPLPIEAFCILFPGGMRLTGEDADPAKQGEYAGLALGRAAELGGRTVVFGSGGARRVPDGFDRARAYSQLVRVGRMLGETAEKNGLEIALEPLYKRGCNIINTQAEGLGLVRDVDHPAFRLLCDWCHLTIEGGNRGDIAACAGYLAHTHIANPATRALPEPGDGFDYADFFEGIRRAGYRGRVSVEADTGRWRNLAASLEFLKKIAQESQNLRRKTCD